MALINTTELGQARKNLTGWLRGQLPDAADVSVSEVTSPTASGMSNEILIFDASWAEQGDRVDKGLVARVEPTTWATFPTYDLRSQAALMSALATATDIPVPGIIGVETDTSVLGASFLVMERAHGQAPADDPPYTVAGWVSELDGTQRATLWDNALRQLAAIHAVDWHALNLGYVNLSSWGEPGIDQQIGYLDHLRSWVMGGRTHATVDGAFEWLRANKPTEPGPIVLNWGDARPGNMLFDHALAVNAVLDWEMASLAAPEVDLGLWLFMQRHHTEGIGAPLPEGIPDHATTARRYQELTGYQPRNLEFYEVFAALRGSILMSRYADLMIAAGILPPDSAMWTTSPATQLLARMCELPPPDGTSSSWIGQRG
jgi:aminoglycoside phosphotransferase (APT) family kinase protein